MTEIEPQISGVYIASQGPTGDDPSGHVPTVNPVLRIVVIKRNTPTLTFMWMHTWILKICSP